MTEKEKIFKWLSELEEQHKIHQRRGGLRPCKMCLNIMDKIRNAVGELKEE